MSCYDAAAGGTLPSDWDHVRSNTATSGSDTAGYYRNRITGETSLQRPQPLSEFDVKRGKQRCVAALATVVGPMMKLGASDATDVAEFLVECWEEVVVGDAGRGGVDAFRTAIGGRSSGLSVKQTEEVYHLLHVAHPVKRVGYLTARRHREKQFDPHPPRGWEVRESTSNFGNFYYLHSASGQTSVARPAAAGGGSGVEGTTTNNRAALSALKKQQQQQQEVYVATEVEMKVGADERPVEPKFLIDMNVSPAGAKGGSTILPRLAAATALRPAGAAAAGDGSASTIKPTTTSSLVLRSSGGALARAAMLESTLLEMQKKKTGRVGGGEGGGWKQWAMPAVDGASSAHRALRLGVPATPAGGGGDAERDAAASTAPAAAPVALPINAHREALIAAIAAHRVLIVIGETGSGKTSQIPQYVADALPGVGMVACTQPRRVSAISVAQRVAQERAWHHGRARGRVGDEVGYAVRFEDRTSEHTRIKYMTDGVLLREMLVNPTLRGYKVVMVDEAHERTVTSDTLLFLIKMLLEAPATAASSLRVLISSATLDAEKFSTYFGGAAAFFIPGRTHPVETFYVKDREEDWYAMALKVVFEIHVHEGEGDILVFLTGAEEIDAACQICYEWYLKLRKSNPDTPMLDMLILPLYSSLAGEVQSTIFEPPPANTRKVIFSTNVAETSITIDGIVFVVDSGFARVMSHDPVAGMDCLVVAPVSQAAARQRAGRAGRTRPGKCFRLYTEHSYDKEMLPQTVPEMQRACLETTLLLVKQYPNVDIRHIEFLDAPPVALIHAALFNLFHLGALDEDGNVTPLGQKLLSLPVEPHLAKLLLVSVDLDCTAGACAVVGLLTCGAQVFHRPRGKEKEADTAKGKLVCRLGDHATLLRVACAAQEEAREHDADVPGWCRDRFVNPKAVDMGGQIAAQLMRVLLRQGLVEDPAASAPAMLAPPLPPVGGVDLIDATAADVWGEDDGEPTALAAPRQRRPPPSSPAAIAEMLRLPHPHSDQFRRAARLLAEAVGAASPTRIAKRQAVQQNAVQYRTTVAGVVCPVHPSSVYAHRSFDTSPKWVAYHDLVQTRKEYVRTVTAVDPRVLLKHCPSLYQPVRTEYKGDAAKQMRAAAVAEEEKWSGKGDTAKRPRDDERGEGGGRERDIDGGRSKRRRTAQP